MVHGLRSTPEVRCRLYYGGLLKMAECLAARLSAQEAQIRLLTKEISSLRDGLSRGLDTVEIIDVPPELEGLRAENEKLRYRLLHLRRGLQTELLREEGQGRKQPGTKRGKAPEKNATKVQQKNNCPPKKVGLINNSGSQNHSFILLVILGRGDLDVSWNNGPPSNIIE